MKAKMNRKKLKKICREFHIVNLSDARNLVRSKVPGEGFTHAELTLIATAMRAAVESLEDNLV